MEEIAIKVREMSEKPYWKMPKPHPKEPKKWLRFDCPFCHGRGKSPDTAAVNYDAQWFECYRCENAFGAWGQSNPANDGRLAELLRQYAPLLKKVVRHVKGKYGKWVQTDELTSYAMQLMWNYSYRPKGGHNDAGMFDDWEADTIGNQDLMERYLLEALNNDLLNHAQRIKEWKSRGGVINVPKGVQIEITVANPQIDDDNPYELGNGSGVATSQLEHIMHREVRVPTESTLTQRRYEALAENEDIPFTAWGRSVLKCDRKRNGLGPHAKGDCQWCDKARANDSQPSW